MNNYSLETVYHNFLDDRDTYCSDATVNNYRNTIGYFVRFMESLWNMPAIEIPIKDITLKELNAYAVYLKNKVKNDTNPYFNNADAVKISTRTRKDYLKDLKALYTFAYDNDYITVNVADKVKLPKVYQQPIEVLTNDEVHIIDDCYSSSSALGCRNLAMIHCMLDEGMRSGEVQRLKLSDVNSNENYIVIRNSKGGKGRMFPMAYCVRKYIRKYIDDYRPDVSHDYVFCSQSGARVTPDAIKSLFDRLKVKSGIFRIYPHLLRHTFATSFILGGGSVEVLRIYLGHSSIETTQKYMHIADNMRFRQNVYRLDKCFVSKFY